VVDSSYTGPKFEPGVITEEFVKTMIEEFKNQKKIHKKYVKKATYKYIHHNINNTKILFIFGTWHSAIIKNEPTIILYSIRQYTKHHI